MRLLVGLDPIDGICHSASQRLDIILDNSKDKAALSGEIVTIGKVALEAFLQSNVTGPPLGWDSSELIPPHALWQGASTTKEKARQQLISQLSVDGEAVYRFIPNVELFYFAKSLLNHPGLSEVERLARERLRVNSWHQRLLDQISSTLEQNIYNDLSRVQEQILAGKHEDELDLASFLIERASVHILHGYDAKARADLKQATGERAFEFALTGRLGKRTKFQEKEISQLVVLAKSAEHPKIVNARVSHTVQNDTPPGTQPPGSVNLMPQTLNLNDDTLLESISFTESTETTPAAPGEQSVPASLDKMDPSNQPLLQPLDAIILLGTASSITNTSPQDGLTREETVPYAERVLSGGSSNWQVYTQALIVRSRIEGYRTRTIERGVLQLQAVVDQVIAETTPISDGEVATIKSTSEVSSTTFLPQLKQSESAPATERLQYIHQLASPTRWKLEAELADRWVSLGGLRTALEIYERLQMWAEAALCWAANDREDKARMIIRHQLYNSAPTEKLQDGEKEIGVEEFTIEKDPLPANAPRLLCILGDLEKSPSAYERAWEVSNQRFARAQRSLGNYHMAHNDLAQADEAYVKALKADPQNHATWFALGCVRLQSEDWAAAVEAFGRAVGIEDSDAESWSNLAVALLKLPSKEASGSSRMDSQTHLQEAFVATKRAATLKRDNSKIWQNLLTVAIKLSPPPYADIVVTQSRLIELLAASEGEKCIDIPLIEALLNHIVMVPSISEVANGDDSEAKSEQHEESRSKKGLEKMVIDLIQKKITPLITSSRRLWQLSAKLSLYLQRPLATLSAYEKAWRSTLNMPGWDSALSGEAKTLWKEVADATVELIDAYESLGDRTREAGMGEGEAVCKDWKFKARSAARTVLSRAKEGWEGDGDYDMLSERLQELKAT